MYNLFLCIQANSSSLKGFLSAVRLAHRGCDVEAPLLTFTPVKTSEFEKFKTKMVITSKKDYPLSKNFPYSLEHLQTSYCGLARVDIRMLSLKNLRKLDLSHNHIKKLPATIGDLIHLQELNLNDNHLESFSVALCQSTLQKSLRSLDRSGRLAAPQEPEGCVKLNSSKCLAPFWDLGAPALLLQLFCTVTVF